MRSFFSFDGEGRAVRHGMWTVADGEFRGAGNGIGHEEMTKDECRMTKRIGDHL